MEEVLFLPCFFVLSFHILYSPSVVVFFFIDFELIATPDRLALIRQQRAEAAKKREEEKAGMVPVTNYLHFVLRIFLLLFVMLRL